MAVLIREALKYAPLPAIVVTKGARNEPPQAIQCDPTSAPTLPKVLAFTPLACCFLFIASPMSIRLIAVTKENRNIDKTLGSVTLLIIVVNELIIKEIFSKKLRLGLVKITPNRSRLVRYTNSHNIENQSIIKRQGLFLISKLINQTFILNVSFRLATYFPNS